MSMQCQRASKEGRGNTCKQPCEYLLNVLTRCVFDRQLVVVAYDDGEPAKTNTTLVEITVLQPSVIPVFTQEKYRYIYTHTYMLFLKVIIHKE